MPYTLGSRPPRELKELPRAGMHTICTLCLKPCHKPCSKPCVSASSQELKDLRRAGVRTFAEADAYEVEHRRKRALP